MSVALATRTAAATESVPTRGAIHIDNVRKVYDSPTQPIVAVDGCSLRVEPGEICMVVGPSGCGKTTLLNAIAGFHGITSGSITLDDEVLCGPNRSKAEPGSDRIVVFQNGALFPWMTNVQNVAFGPTAQRKLGKSEALEKARAMMQSAGLAGLENSYPGEVSSGTRRRVEIVRALMNDPKVLLLDEPFRALDSLTRQVMHEVLLEIHHKNRVTVFFITHDLEEAIFLGRRVALMTTRPCKLKRLVSVDLPYPRPASIKTSRQFRELLEESRQAVHEEALAAFEAGEREG